MKIKFLVRKVVSKFYFVSIISVRSTPLREKERIRIRIRTSDLRIRMAQKLTVQRIRNTERDCMTYKTF